MAKSLMIPVLRSFQPCRSNWVLSSGRREGGFRSSLSTTQSSRAKTEAGLPAQRHIAFPAAGVPVSLLAFVHSARAGRGRPARLRGAATQYPMSEQLFARQGSALDESFEFGPHHGLGDTFDHIQLSESAVGSGDHVFSSGNLRITNDTIGDHARMLHRDRVVGDDS